MNSFEPQQPDEGYSEAPLSGSGVLATKPAASSSSTTTSTMTAPSTLATLSPMLIQHINSLSQASKIQLVESLLESLPTNVVAQIVQQLSPRLYIDFIRYLPPEICLNILSYLDPLSLISVARSCRAWYGLALDRHLWESLYYLEGWKAVAPAIKAWEEIMNRDRPVASEGGRMSKRRAIASSSRRAATGTDRDHVMLDRTPEPSSKSVSPAPLPQEASTTSSSIFGSTASTVVASSEPSFREDTDSSSSIAIARKGKQRASSPPPPDGGVETVTASASTPASASASTPTPTSNTLPRNSLWSWDAASERHRLNWKHMYTLRRRLESNWELGKFRNFQFPHPDHPEEAHSEWIYTIQFDAEYLVSGSRDRTIRIWNLQTCRLMQQPLQGHKGSVLCLQFDADADEDLIVSGSSDSKVILWRFSTGEILQRLAHAHHEPVLNVKFDKNILVTCSKDNTIKVFSRRPLKPGELGYDSPHGGSSTSAAAAAVDPVPVVLKNYTDGSTLFDQLPIKPAYSLLAVLQGHSAAVNAVQIHGREIVSASGDRNVKIWDWPTQSCVRTLIGHSKGIACVQYDGRRIVSGSSDNEVKVFDRTTGLEVASLHAHKHLVRTVQAGFGDMPFSQEEDERAAAQFDAKYREYRQNGLYEDSAHTTHRRHAREQAAAEAAALAAAGLPAGSAAEAAAAAAAQAINPSAAAEDDEDYLLRPENIRFTGAKLPPGGGGGQYGRIVSGSYDTTIIIWRRDRRGVWKAQHHLRQEEAAAAATAAAAEAAAAAAEASPPVITPSAMHIDPSAAGVGSLLSAASADVAAVFDNAVHLGVQTLQRILTANPALLGMDTALQAAIASHPSPFVRSQMQETVAGLRQRQADSVSGSGSGSGSSGSGSSIAGVPPATPGLPGIHHILQPEVPAAGMQIPTVEPAVAEHLQQMQQLQQVSVLDPSQQPFAHVPAVPLPTPPVHHHHHHQHHGNGGQAAAAAAGGEAGARVFKLQFDARRIICCSQTAVIVGWDFCNGDRELEEASKFFATID